MMIALIVATAVACCWALCATAAALYFRRSVVRSAAQTAQGAEYVRSLVLRVAAGDLIAVEGALLQLVERTAVEEGLLQICSTMSQWAAFLPDQLFEDPFDFGADGCSELVLEPDNLQPEILLPVFDQKACSQSGASSGWLHTPQQSSGHTAKSPALSPVVVGASSGSPVVALPRSRSTKPLADSRNRGSGPPTSPAMHALRARRGSFVHMSGSPHVDHGAETAQSFAPEALNLAERHEGTIVLISAEDVVVAWNTSKQCTLHSTRAAMCALEARGFPMWRDGAAGATTGTAFSGFTGTPAHLAAVALGAPIQRARLLARLCPVIGCSALCDSGTHSAATSASTRVVDAVLIDGRAEDEAAVLVYEISPAATSQDHSDVTEGFAYMLTGQYEAAAAAFSRQLQRLPRDRQVRRLLRVALSHWQMQNKADVGATSYFRAFEGWQDWELDDDAVPAEYAQLLQERHHSRGVASRANRMSVNVHAGLSVSDDMLLRRRIEEISVCPQTGCDEGIPERFTDERDIEWFRSDQLLGRGGFGEVWLGMTRDGAMVAVKTLRLAIASQQQLSPRAERRRKRQQQQQRSSCAPAASSGQVDDLLNEVTLMVQLRHENVVSFLGAAVAGQHVFIVMEYCSGGSLQGLGKQFKTGLPVSSVRRYTRDTTHGLCFLHSKDVVHRDLKPPNVLVSPEGVAKLADFGASALMKQCSAGGVLGTPLYMAPEAAAGRAEKASDIWSLGIMVYELVCGCMPWDLTEYNPHQFLYRIAHDEELRPQLQESTPPAVRTFVDRCTRRNPADRPPATALLSEVYVIQ